MNFTVELTTNILNNTRGFGLVGETVKKIGLDFESDTTLKPSEKSILRILAGLLLPPLCQDTCRSN